MLMTSLRIYSENKNQALKRGVSLLCSFFIYFFFFEWSLFHTLPVNTHIQPHILCQSPVEPTVYYLTGFNICFICIWRHKCHPFWARCSSGGPVKEFRIDWFSSDQQPSLLPPSPHPTTQPATHPCLSPEPITGFLGRWAVLAIVRLKTNEMRRRHRGKPTKR